MKKTALTSLAPLLGASSSAFAAIGLGPDLNVGITAYDASDVTTWSLDGNDSSFGINRSLSTAGTTSSYSITAYGTVSIYNSSGAIAFATSAGKMKLLATGDPLSASAGLNFKSSFYAQSTATTFTSFLTFGQSFAALRAASYAMINLFGVNSGTNEIIGFRFAGASGTYYGWANATWQGTADDFSLSFTNVTYSDSDGILAGTTSEIPEAQTTAVGLGALALGAAGLCRWRKRKTA